MVTLFDKDVSTVKNKLLMDKPQFDGSSLPRCPADLAMSSDEDELILSQFRETCSRTPMKILLENELSKEAVSRYAAPDLFARQMGIDPLPKGHISTFPEGKEDHPSAMIGSEEPLPSRRHEPDLFGKFIPCEVEPFKEEFVSDPYHLKNSERGVAFIGHEYVDPRHLPANENVDSSDESDGVLGNLNYTKDLFLEFLQQPNSLFDRHLHEISTRPPRGTKHITVLKPSSTADYNKIPSKITEKWVTKQAQISQANGWNKTNIGGSPVPSNRKANDDPQPTRIVLLKPFLEKAINTGDEYTSPSMLPRILHDKTCFLGRVPHEAQQSRDMAKEVTNIIRESVGSLHRDPFLSSALSSGYNGDESSPEKTEIEYATSSGCEPISSTSRYSWDYMDQFASCSSSISRVPCARESSIFREAKKRLSKRWNAMGLNEKSQGKRHARTHSSNTLGEMLAISEIKKWKRSHENKEELICSALSLNQDSKKDQTAVCSPRSLIRSSPVPLSAGGKCEWVSDEVSRPEVVKSPEKELQKPNSVKQLVANLFFARGKKSNKDYFTQRTVAGGSSPLEMGLSVAKPVMAGNLMESQDQPSPNSVLEPLFGDDESRSADSSGIISSEHPAMKTSGYKTNSPVIGKSPPIESISRTQCWNNSCADATSSGCPLNLSLVCSEPEEEKDWNILVQVLLSTVGLSNCMPADACMEWCDTAQMSLDPLLRDEYANATNHFMHGAKLRRWRSNRKLIFDSVNQALKDISQLDLEPNIESRTGHYDTALPVLVDHVWATMSRWMADNVRCVPTGDAGEMNGNLAIERVVRMEVAGKSWLESGFIKTNTVGIHIQQKLLEELLEETVLLLPTWSM